VGTWLTQHLRAQGDEVTSIDHEVDVTSGDALSEAVREIAPEAVYHLAALSHVGRSWADPAEVLRVNALGTLNVLEAARACPRPPRVLVTSSAEVYGAVTDDMLPLLETSTVAPVTPYGASKAAAEILGLQAHLGYGLEVVVVRPFNHVGPGQGTEFAVSSLASKIVDARRCEEKQLSVGNLAARRDLTDVRDVVRAYRLLVERADAGEVFNVCTGVDVSISEVAEMLLEIAGVDLEVVVDPSLVRRVDVPVLRGDPGKLETSTGWKPEISLSKTLEDVLEYFEREAS